MRRVLFCRAGIVALSLSMAVLSGCFGTSPPARFYNLSSLRSPEPAPSSTPGGNVAILAVGPTMVPDYLNRPEIMTRAGRNEMRVNEYRRWAGSLESNLSRSIIENLSVLLPSERYSVVRWLPSAQSNVPIRYRFMVDVIRFDADPGGTVLLEADWSVYGMDKEVLLMRKSTVGGKVNGTEFADVIAAMSKTLEELCRDIASAVTILDRVPSKN